MALQVNKTLDSGLVASYWRIASLRSEFSGSDTPVLHVTVEGYKDADYRAKAAVVDSHVFQLDGKDFYETSVGVSGVGPGWSGLMTGAANDIRPNVYDWLKKDDGGAIQNGGFISGAVDA